MGARTRFTLEHELGHGGEGRVFAVRDAARGGAIVALKETHGPMALALAREFELLQTLRHRHLAEVYEYFPESPLGGARAAYTQMLVPGDDLYQTLRVSPALADLLVGQLLLALAQLHAAGLAHLDLKPDNVIVELLPAPRARLVDFGIAARIGSRPDMVRGSRSYVAPEILGGQPVSARANLFSLGIALAEVALGSASGARALAEEPAATRRAKLEHTLGAPLAQLAATLMALDPAQRPMSAAAAARLWGVLRTTSLELVTPASATGLVRSGGLIARAAEKARVLDAVRRREVLVIGGPPASGRTALMESALCEAQLTGLSVEAWPLVAATASVEGFSQALGRLVPGADRLLLTPAAEDTASPERWAASLDAAAEAAATALSELRSEGPAALFVRHPRAAPAPVRAFLRAVRRQALRPNAPMAPLAPLAFILGAEPAEPADVLLGPVSAGAVRAFIASRFGPEVAGEDALVSALASASGGLTGHLEALLELLVARATLVLGDGSWRLDGDPATLALPADLGQAIASRLALLELAERDVLQAVTALSWPGQGLGVGTIEAALGAPAGVVVDDLVALGLVRRDGRGSVALGHPVLAGLVTPLALDPAARRRVLASPELAEAVRARLEGGVEGSRRALAVARQALQASLPEDAERAVMLALELATPGSAEALDALSLRADVADRLGPREAQAAALRALIAGLALSLEATNPRRLEAEARLFWTLTRMADPSLESDGEALVARARAAGQARLAAEVAVHLAIVASQRGDQDRAEALLVAARGGLSDDGDTLALRARISNNLGNVYAYRGAFQRAQDAYREARRLKIEEADPVGERIALGNMALMALELGEPARALCDVARSFELARLTGHRRGEAWSLLTLAEIGLEGGSPRYARRRAVAAAALAATLGDHLVESDARTTLAEALLELGAAPEAATEAARGAALADAAENRRTATRARAIQRLAALRSASGAERARLEREIVALVHDAGADATTRQLAARHAAELALARGDTAGALDLLGPSGEEPVRGGVRWAELVYTRLRVQGVAGSAEALAPGTRQRLSAWVGAWPETPLADGVDEAALTEGPCRQTVLTQPAVMALLAGDLSGDTRPVRNAEEPVLPDETRSLASLTAAQLDHELMRALVEVVRRLDAERAFIVSAGEAVTVLDARDADGEPVADAKRRLPEAVLEAVRRGAPWLAPGVDNRGAIAVVPWRLPLGEELVSGAVVLQNRFLADAFSDAARSAEAVARLYLPLRLKLLEAALERARSTVHAVAAEARATEARTTEEIRSLRRELESTREQLGPAREYPEIVFASSAMKKMLRQVDRVVATDLPVHIHGESGTGKELVARAIHQLGARARGPFVPQNCTAIPPTLFESELFGHERGAFTGAMRATEGLFRRAHGGTLFLDEIGDLPLELQAKLLRVLETGEVRPVGATRSISVDVRIVSATHRDLGELIKKGSFREDLFYRLNVIRIDVPALRDRPEDIPALVQHFVARRSAPDLPLPRLDDAAMRALVRFAWPGNVRQLENEIARATLLAENGVIGLSDLSPEIGRSRGEAPAKGGGDPLAGLGLAHGSLKDRVDRLEALALEAALREADGNKSEVARVLGLSRAGLNLKLKRLGLWDL